MKKKTTTETKKWDKYWTKKRNNTQIIYDKIAEFYRKILIKPALNYFIEINFKKGCHLLHAGCGTGQVDTDLTKDYKITGVDVSKEALNMYRKTIGESSKLIQADVKNIPVKLNTFDGVYNLGLMEHFDEEDINQILQEFRRVLKPNGKIIFFWPPIFGISVITLKLAHKLLNLFSNKKITLHPNEITLAKSKEQIESMLKNNGFKLTKFYFGPRDMFTHCIIVAKKDSSKR